MKYPSSKWIMAGAIALAFSATTMFGQGVTTSEISGFVTDKAGAPISGAKVVATHIPTGTHYQTVSNSTGTYAIDGLRPGGPYSVEVTAPDGTTALDSGLYVNVGSTLKENLKPTAEV